MALHSMPFSTGSRLLERAIALFRLCVVATHISIAQVIGKDENDVRLCRKTWQVSCDTKCACEEGSSKCGRWFSVFILILPGQGPSGLSSRLLVVDYARNDMSDILAAS